MKRRIMLGTWPFPPSYYETYYMQALKMRTLIRQDFEKAFERCDVLAAPTTPTVAFRFGERQDNPLEMYQSDLLTVSGQPSGDPRAFRAVRVESGGPSHRPSAHGPPWAKRRSFGRRPPTKAAAGWVYRHGPGWRWSNVYEVIIGLEIHVELFTESKVWCGCSTQFGAEANTQVCPVCLGLPGTLPVLNERALEFAVKAGLALGCEISHSASLIGKTTSTPTCPRRIRSRNTTCRSAATGRWSLR